METRIEMADKKLAYEIKEAIDKCNVDLTVVVRDGELIIKKGIDVRGIAELTELLNGRQDKIDERFIREYSKV